MGEANEIHAQEKKYKSFWHCLKETGICDPNKFLKFKNAVAELTLQTVRNIGYDAAVNALKLPTNEKSRVNPKKTAQAAFIEAAANYQSRAGVPLPADQAREMVRNHKPKALRVFAEPIYSRSALESLIDKLKTENSALKTENAALKTENAALRAQLSGSAKKGRARAQVAQA